MESGECGQHAVHKKTSRGGGFTKGSPMSFAFPKTGLFVGMHNCLDGFPQALPEIKNGKVADYKKLYKKKNLSFVLEF